MSDAPVTRVVILHHAGPSWQAGLPIFEQAGVREHVGHYRGLLEQGLLSLGGPFLDERGGGMMVSVAGADLAELAAYAAQDPAVIAGLLTCDVRPWMIGMDAAR